MRILLTLAFLTSFTTTLHAQPKPTTDEPSVGCVDIQTVPNTTTPIAILKGVKECIMAAEYDKAVALYGLGSTATRFDSLRVTDKTAHQAGPILAMYAVQGVPDANREAFFGTLKGYTNPTDPKFLTLCAGLAAKGPPTYTPTYMVAHGMQAFSKGSSYPDALVPDFDAAAAWKKALDLHLHCKL